MSHPDLIRRIVKTTPNHRCVVEGDRALTFREVDERADRAAEAWLTAGLSPGERVAVLAHNELEYVEWQMAAQRAGLVLVPLNTRLRVPELRRILQDSTPELLVHGPGFEEAADALSVPRTWHLGRGGAGECYEDLLASVAPVRRTIEDPGALATLLYTSGTTGTAKGAMISNRALLARSLAIALELRLSAGDVFLQGLPLFHLAQTFSCSFSMVGATNILMRTFDPTAALSAMQQHRVSHTLVVPTILKMLLAAPALAATDRSSLRAVLYGGSPISSHDLTAALEAFDCDFYQMYGMTETGPATLLFPAQHDLARPELLTSAGSEIATFDLAVVDETGARLPAGEGGEIVISGPGLMEGFWRSSEQSVSALRGGAMHTGDLGHLSDGGLLYVTGRLKEMIITGGENVVPGEVEDVLLGHPAVAECAVLGVPDPNLGERVHAVLVAAHAADLPLSQLDQLCRERLAGYKRPRSWSSRDSLPRTATGKVQRHRLKEELGTSLADNDSPDLTEDGHEPIASREGAFNV